MINIKIERSFYATEPPLIEQVCWLAREVLGGYMEQGVELETAPDDLLATLQHIENDEDDDEEAGPGTDIWVHDTPVVQINSRDCASLSNLPYVHDADNDLVPIVEPGYVALRVGPIDPKHPDDWDYLNKRSQQVIFHPPDPSREEEAAIYVGFDMDPAHQIDPDSKADLQRLQHVLKGLRTIYRQMHEQDSQTYTNSYLAAVPARAVSDELIEEWFGPR